VNLSAAQQREDEKEVDEITLRETPLSPRPKLSYRQRSYSGFFHQATLNSPSPAFPSPYVLSHDPRDKRQALFDTCRLAKQPVGKSLATTASLRLCKGTSSAAPSLQPLTLASVKTLPEHFWVVTPPWATLNKAFFLFSLSGNDYCQRIHFSRISNNQGGSHRSGRWNNCEGRGLYNSSESIGQGLFYAYSPLSGENHISASLGRAAIQRPCPGRVTSLHHCTFSEQPNQTAPTALFPETKQEADWPPHTFPEPN